MPVNKIEIRESTPLDIVAVEQLYPLAFPDENLVPLVKELLDDPERTTSMVAIVDSVIVGHIIFTACTVTDLDASVALLGPLAVTPALQKQGIGSALIHSGKTRSSASGTSLICVLGDPTYYGQFGFVSERHIEPPYKLPDQWMEAWQSLSLNDAIDKPCGKLIVPTAWSHEQYWSA
ncbi:MAG: GNAT family N-acetyltransferase [Granulosicoccus sp.]